MSNRPIGVYSKENLCDHIKETDCDEITLQPVIEVASKSDGRPKSRYFRKTIDESFKILIICKNSEKNQETVLEKNVFRQIYDSNNVTSIIKDNFKEQSENLILQTISLFEIIRHLAPRIEVMTKITKKEI